MQKEKQSRFRQIISRPAVKWTAQGVLVLVCIFFIGQQLATYWQDVRHLLASLRWGRALVSFTFLAISFTLSPALIPAYTRLSPSPVSYAHSMRAYFGSQLVKYLPGSIWAIPGRVVLLNRLGYDPSWGSFALLAEMFTQAAVSFLVGILFLGFSLLTNFWPGWVTWVVIFLTVAVLPLLLLLPEIKQRLLPKLIPDLEAFANLGSLPLSRRFGNAGLAVLLYTLQSLLAGAGFYFALASLSEQGLSLALLPQAVGVFSLSWFLGFITPISPGGLGVREAAITLLLAAFVPVPIPVLAALLYRFFWLLLELAFFALVWRLIPQQTPGPKEGQDEELHQ